MKLSYISMLFVALTPASFSFARGAGSTGGAGVIVCETTALVGYSVRLLDLYEAELAGQNLPNQDALPLYDSLLRAVRKVHVFKDSPRANDVTFLRDYTKSLVSNLYKSNLRFTAPGERLPSTGDFGAVPQLPLGCKLDQVAVYHDDDHMIDIVTDYWLKMSAQDQAAVIFHEVIYREYRAAGETTSEKIRKIVGDNFSLRSDSRISDGLSANAFICSGIVAGDNNNGLSLYIDNKDDHAVVRLVQLQGRSLYDVTDANIPFQIPRESLESRMQDNGRIYTYVNRPDASRSAISEFKGGVFSGSKISVINKDDKPLLFSFYNSTGNLILNAYITSCD
ncbi:MAG: hypothetical protein NTV34_16505 [Proteobacteria bacterium]|nr:hypothetical protein [Pseudomonadota bacterium]